jgi:DUF1680 family protein
MKLYLGGGLVAAWGFVALAAAADYPIQPVPFTAVRLTGGLWHQRQEVNRTVTVPFALQQCEDTGRLRNFDLAAEVMRRRAGGEPSFQIKPPTKFPFDDSDVFKAIEGAAYVLSQGRDAALEARLDAIIARIAAAQEPDGYLYTWRTMHPDAPAHKWIDPRRWLKDPEASHELYNIGHLYEAGVAYFEATGRRNLLDVCLKSAELVWRDFGDGSLRIAPGHQVIEMGLVKLYRVTGDGRFLKLARVFLEARGPGQSSYNQRHLPVVDQTTAVGHAVRANYLYAGMADVAALTGDTRYTSAIAKIWDDAAGRKMYVTGSVGALAKGEAYGADYELPLDGYNETCAAIAFMMWSHRMFLLTGEARYLDVLERTAYNGALSGVSLSGDRFFYPNPVVYDGERKFNHGFAGRAPWFGCACCPPNVVRTLASLSGYFYAVRGDTLFVNLYGGSRGTAGVGGRTVGLAQTTGYPWQGRVRLAVTPDAPARFAVALRIPGWARHQPVPSDLYRYDGGPEAAWSVRVNGEPVRETLAGGHLVVRREWRAGDVVELDFDLPVRRVRGHPAIAAVAGRVALERGPVVYCVEEPERRFVPDELALPEAVRPEPRWRPELLGGVVTLGWRDDGREIAALPYHAWNNRGLAPMAVWLRAAPRLPAGP